jgi:hypothetical protein
MRRFAQALLLTIAVAVALVVLVSAPAQAQQRSGSTVLGFLDAVDRVDIDAALFRVLAEVEVTLPDGTLLFGKEELRPYLEEFPRPIEIREHRNLRRMAYEAKISAGGMPLLLTFRGMLGIAAVRIEEDPPSPPPPVGEDPQPSPDPPPED